MTRILILLFFITSCSSGNKPSSKSETSTKANGSTTDSETIKKDQTHGTFSELISDKETAKIYSSFDYINKQIWAINQSPKNQIEYIDILKQVPNGSKKEDAQSYVKNMQMFTCLRPNNFVVCGYLEKTFTFCDDARTKLDRKMYREHVGAENLSVELSKQLGCL